MNALSEVFYNQVCHLLSDEGLFEAQKLSGRCGRLASRDWFSYFARTTDDDKEPGLHNADEEPGLHSEFLSQIGTGRRLRTAEQIESVPKRFVREVTLGLVSAEDGKVSREVVQRFPYAKFYNFALFESSISEAWVNFACSMKRIGFISISDKMEEDEVRLFQKLVDYRSLSKLRVSEEACEGSIIEVLKCLLCQDQFQELNIDYHRQDCSSVVVRDVFKFWSQNSEKMRGKSIVLDEGVNQLVQFLIDRTPASSKLCKMWTKESLCYLRATGVLKHCSKEEYDHIDKYYRHDYFLFFKPLRIFKLEEDEQRSLYIAFDYTEQTRKRKLSSSRKGEDELWSLWTANSCRLMFP
uniref:F-box domain-containing protein n=1 Tax=Steinernema glaseri TaxID=37863 RepID=A0A1I7ZTF8_9BILA